MIRFVFIVAALVVTFTSTSADARWLRAETNNFIIYSEGSERALRDFAENLQRFDGTLRLRFNIPGGFEPNRLTIYLVDRADEAGRLATGKTGSSIAGFYSVRADGSFAVSNRENSAGRGTPASQQTLFHEYGHHFMKRYMPAAFPAWFIEGFAEYFSSVDFTKDGRPSLGKPVHRRAYGLVAMPRIPVDQLLFQRPGAMRNSGQLDVYYGRAWLLTHMLFHDPRRDGQLIAYMVAINRGEPPDAAARAIFGDLGQLDKDLNRYINRPLTYTTLFQPIQIEGSITITSLSESESALVPLRLERLSAEGDTERMAFARDSLRKLAAVHTENAQLWYELAAAEWNMGKDQRDISAVRTAVDRALALQANHVRANVMLGRILAAELEEKGDYSDASWRAVRAPLTLANRTNPDDPVPLYVYFQSFGGQGVRPPDIALQGLAQAFSLEPENVSIRFSHAFALANQGRFDAAVNLAESMAFDPHDRGDGQRLLDAIEAMRDRGQRDTGPSDNTED